jgi:hypothetical protein
MFQSFLNALKELVPGDTSKPALFDADTEINNDCHNDKVKLLCVFSC